MSGSERPCGPPGMQRPECADPPGSGSTGVASSMVNSKIMVVAVAVLFAVVVFILCLHVYAKWYWRTQAVAAQQPQPEERSWRRRPQLQVVVQVQQTSVGLERAVIEALPTFEFDGKQHLLECAVCLEVFEPGEKGRTLPKCGHHFHLDCVDMWLYSHSTCPMCRASAQPGDVVVPLDEQPVIVDVPRRQRQRSRSASQLPPTSPIRQQQQLPPIPSSSSSEEPKAGEIPANVLFCGDQPSASTIRAPFQVTIDVPRGGLLHPASVMSPMARASASFRRLLSRGQSVVSPHDSSPSSPRTPPGAS